MKLSVVMVILFVLMLGTVVLVFLRGEEADVEIDANIELAVAEEGALVVVRRRAKEIPLALTKKAEANEANPAKVAPLAVQTIATPIKPDGAFDLFVEAVDLVVRPGGTALGGREFYWSAVFQIQALLENHQRLHQLIRQSKVRCQRSRYSDFTRKLTFLGPGMRYEEYVSSHYQSFKIEREDLSLKYSWTYSRDEYRRPKTITARLERKGDEGVITERREFVINARRSERGLYSTHFHEFEKRGRALVKNIPDYYKTVSSEVLDSLFERYQPEKVSWSFWQKETRKK